MLSVWCMRHDRASFVEPVICVDGEAFASATYQQELSSAKREVLLQGVDVELTPGHLPDTLSVRIFADTLRILKENRFPGREVWIHARRIVCSDGAAIDVSGRDAADQSGQAPGGLAPGAPGTPGATGLPGATGGRIHITAGTIEGTLRLLSRGGRGGRGQQGGDGARGLAAPDDPGVTPASQLGENPGTQGLVGGRGGDAGSGGQGGPGGPGGSVEVLTLTPGGSVSVEVSGGAGGAPGGAGAAGRGGSGGLGPWGRRCYMTLSKSRARGPGGEVHDHWVKVCERTSAGPRGNDGSAGTTPALAASGARGREGSVQVAGATDEILAGEASGDHCLMLERQANLDFLNGNLEASLPVYVWLSRLLNAQVAPLAMGTAERSALRIRVAAALSDLAQGLDFYGYPRSYAPLVRLDSFGPIVDRFLELLSRTEDAYTRYWKAAHDDQAKIAAVESALEAARSAVQSLHADMDALDIKIPVEEADARTILAAVEGAAATLNSAESRFKQAVASRSGCDFEKVIKGVTAVVSLASAPFEGAKQLVGVFEKEGSYKDKGLIDRIVGSVKIASGTVASIGAKLGEVQQFLDQRPDSAKIAVDATRFREELAPYMTMVEARDYRDVMEEYLSLIESRNHKLIELSAMQTQRARIAGDIEQRQAEMERVKGSYVGTPMLSTCAMFMGSLLAHVKEEVLKLLYWEHRALEYWALRHIPFQVGGATVMELSAAHADLLVEHKKRMVERGSAGKPFKGVKVTLSKDSMPAEFAALVSAERRATFFLSRERFSKLDSCTLVTGVDVVLEGANVDVGTVVIKLVHLGHSVFYDEAGARIDFVHQKRIAKIVRRDGDLLTEAEGNLGGNDEYVDLSPFAAWTIDLSESDATLELATIRAVQMIFTGTFVPSKGVPAS